MQNNEQERLLRDKELVHRVHKHNDSDAFGELYDTYYAQILRYFLYRTADEDLAKDLTSETFYQALKSIWRYKWQNKPFSAWLYRIGHNQHMLYLRKNKRYCKITTEEAPELIAKIEERQDVVLMAKQDEEERLGEYTRVREAMSHLPARQHSILILRFFAKKSIKEIADILRMPEGTVKSHIHRSLKRVQIIMKEMPVRRESMAEKYSMDGVQPVGKSLVKIDETWSEESV